MDSDLTCWLHRDGKFYLVTEAERKVLFQHFVRNDRREVTKLLKGKQVVNPFDVPKYDRNVQICMVP